VGSFGEMLCLKLIPHFLSCVNETLYT